MNLGKRKESNWILASRRRLFTDTERLQVFRSPKGLRNDKGGCKRREGKGEE